MGVGGAPRGAGGIAAGNGRGVRLVLADDAALVRRGLRALLETGGQIEVVDEAADGSALLTAVRRHRPDVVLIDVRLDGVGGLAVLRRLQGLVEPPVVAVLTTEDLADYVTGALESGARGFLLKDAEPAFLIRAVLDLAAGGAVLDPRITARLLPTLRTAGQVLRERQAITALSARERQVLDLLAAGMSNGAIAAALGLTEATVKSYMSTLFAKLDVQNRVQAALVAQRAGAAGEAAG